MTIFSLINDAMYEQKEIVVETKDHKFIIGVPHSLDEFDTDEERLGVSVWIDDTTVKMIFLDEIISVYTVSNKATA